MFFHDLKNKDHVHTAGKFGCWCWCYLLREKNYTMTDKMGVGTKIWRCVWHTASRNDLGGVNPETAAKPQCMCRGHATPITLYESVEPRVFRPTTTPSNWVHESVRPRQQFSLDSPLPGDLLGFNTGPVDPENPEGMPVNLTCNWQGEKAY